MGLFREKREHENWGESVRPLGKEKDERNAAVFRGRFPHQAEVKEKEASGKLSYSTGRERGLGVESGGPEPSAGAFRGSPFLGRFHENNLRSLFAWTDEADEKLSKARQKDTTIEATGGAIVNMMDRWGFNRSVKIRET